MKSKGYLFLDALMLIVVTTVISYEVFTLNEIHKSYESAYTKHQEFNQMNNETYY